MEFFGRETQLESLNSFLLSEQAGFVFVRGRRRVGKSWLLKELERQHPENVFYFMGAKDADDRAHRMSFADLWDKFAYSSLSDLRTERLTWQRLFEEVTNYAKNHPSKPLLLCFDEIQWLCRGRAGVAGRIKEAWHDWEKLGVKVVVCGSSKKFFYEETEGDEALLRGMVTRSDINVPEFSIQETHTHFFPKWSIEQIILLQMMFGGLPYYFNRIQGDNFIRAVNDAAFTKESIFLGEPYGLLGLEFNKSGVNTAKTILGCLGQGGARASDIIARTGLAESTAYENIEKLTRYQLLFERTNFAAGQPDKYYFMKDFFLNFFFQILEPLENKIRKNTKSALLFPHEVIQSFRGYYVPNFSGKAFELLIRRLLEEKSTMRERLFSILDLRDENYKVGIYKTEQTEVDIVIEHQSDREARLIECKWINPDNVLPANYVNEVVKKKYTAPKHIEKVSRYVAISQQVSTRTIENAKQKDVSFITLEDLL